MDIKTIFLILAILYALYKAYSIGMSKSKHLGRTESITPFKAPSVIYHGNHQKSELKIEGNELSIVKKHLRDAQIYIDKILKESTANELKEYHKILRKSNPEYKGKPLYVFMEEYKVDLSSELLYLNDFKTILKETLKTRNLKLANEINLNGEGRILGFTIGLTTIDGAPIAESKGFVDYYDIPPIDSWFYLKDDTLLCWIPNEYLAIMQGAINVEICGAYFWLDEINYKLNKELLENQKNT